MVFCNSEKWLLALPVVEVTILILIDGFLQYVKLSCNSIDIDSHNPYFNRWFSAIITIYKVIIMVQVSQSLF